MTGVVPRVLLVDDNREFRRELRLLLEGYGMDVVGEGANGREAIRLAASTGADVVLMDLRMPEMDGLAATRVLRSHSPLVPVIILSTYEDPALESKARGADVYAYLIKGCSGALVRDVVAQAWALKTGLEARAGSRAGSDGDP
jgi:DNA-binding NarL/FixJ family response regulator